MRKLIIGSTAAALLTCSSIAQAAPATSASPIENVRTGAPVGEAENLGGAAMVGGLAILALLIWVYLVQKDDDEDIPASV